MIRWVRYRYAQDISVRPIPLTSRNKPPQYLFVVKRIVPVGIPASIESYISKKKEFRTDVDYVYLPAKVHIDVTIGNMGSAAGEGRRAILNGTLPKWEEQRKRRDYSVNKNFPDPKNEEHKDVVLHIFALGDTGQFGAEALAFFDRIKDYACANKRKFVKTFWMAMMLGELVHALDEYLSNYAKRSCVYPHWLLKQDQHESVWSVDRDGLGFV